MTYLHTINEESQETQPLHKKLNFIFIKKLQNLQKFEWRLLI